MDGPSGSDWIFFLIQIAIAVGSIWLAISLFFRQQRDSQNENYKELNQTINLLKDEIRQNNREIQNVKQAIVKETVEVKERITNIDKTTSQIHSQAWHTQDKMLGQVVEILGGKVRGFTTNYEVIPTKPVVAKEEGEESYE